MGKKRVKVEEMECKPNMSPMIDACFLLLIFFVVNATQITVAKNPFVKMPKAVKCDDLKDAQNCIVVDVFADGEKMDQKANGDKPSEAVRFAEKHGQAIWHVAKSMTDGDKVAAALKDYQPKGYTEDQFDQMTECIRSYKDHIAQRVEKEKIVLYLRGDIAAPWARTNKVIAAAAKAGITNIVFANQELKQ